MKPNNKMKNQIISIECPDCGKEMKSFEDETPIVKPAFKQIMWKCQCSLRVWSEEWFNTFKQFEYCVTRRI